MIRALKTHGDWDYALMSHEQGQAEETKELDFKAIFLMEVSAVDLLFTIFPKTKITWMTEAL